MKPKRLGTDYTRHDLKRMRDMARQGVSARKAAEKLGRTRGAVAYKAMVEGIHFRAIRQPRGAQRKAQRTIRRRERMRAQPLVLATRSG
jgi:hypothetical protein